MIRIDFWVTGLLVKGHKDILQQNILPPIAQQPLGHFTSNVSGTWVFEVRRTYYFRFNWSKVEITFT
jgi:hypothetical protein